MNAEERIIWDAEFNKSVTTYWLLNGIIICVVTVVGLPLLPIWLAVGTLVTRRYLDSHRCTLTSRTLKVSKGIFTKIEKTIPLDRITDLGIIQGPIMRYFEIEALSVETAGQSTASSLVNLAGIKNGRAFRDAVLAQRDLVVGSVEEQSKQPSGTTVGSDPETVQLLREIRDSLKKMESK